MANQQIKLDSLDYPISLNFCDQIMGIHNETDEYIFDIKNSCSYPPLGLLLAGAALRSFSKNNPNAKKYIRVDQQAEATHYAGTMGFFMSVSEKISIGKKPGEATGSRNYFPITCIDIGKLRTRAAKDRQMIPARIEDTAARIGAVLSQGNSELKLTVTYIIREIIRNSEEHSKADKVWICAQHWPRMQFVEIAILDEGCGIRKSLLTNHYYRGVVDSDLSAIKLSLLPGITEAYKKEEIDVNDAWVNSGYGLYMAKKICEHLSGTFTIVSGNGCLNVMSQEKTGEIETSEITADHLYLSGTAVKMGISTNYISRFTDMQKQILMEASTENQKVRHAFRKASKASQGLKDLIRTE